MSDLVQLGVAAREIFDGALRAINVTDAVLRTIRKDGSVLDVGQTKLDIRNRKVYAIAIGKARFPIFELERELGESFAAGFVSGVFPGFGVTGKEIVETKIGTRWRWCKGGHPLPTTSSLLAAEECLKLLNQANNERALLIFLISGGGSAMMESPISNDITLADLRTANKALIESGASIGEVNAVRRAFSAVKGGRLAARAQNCEQVTLIVSDVPRGEEHNVASGPTLTPPPDTPSAVEVVARYALGDQLPPSIMRAIEHPAKFDGLQPNRHQHFVLLDNDTALEAAANAARARGFATKIARDIMDGPIEVGCEALLTHLRNLQSQNPESNVCLISGGEFGCPVRGDGVGGRNSETALRLAILAEQQGAEIGDFVALCAGTDGVDGNSSVAGAIVDSMTIERTRGIGLDPTDFLDRSDSYSFFAALGDAIITGPTGTNVRDIRILICNQQQ